MKSRNLAILSGSFFLLYLSANLGSAASNSTPIGGSWKQLKVYVSPGQVVLGPSGTQQFSAQVAWTTNTSVTWSINPAVGSISNTGLYQAPASITNTTSVIVRATSVGNPTKYAQASLTLANISASTTAVGVSVSPANVNLTASQTQRFSATLTGTTNTAVTWSLNPALGTISSSGTYTAPSSITSSQTVTVTATSAADTTKAAHATVTLNPPTTTVSVALNPTSVSLVGAQTQSFIATVNGTTNNSVTWSLSAPIGTVSTSGLYQAPATVTSTQNLTVTATSVADTTKSAQATITLNPPPPVAVSVTPGNSSLSQGQTQSFSATVVNTTNTAVTWSLSAPVGTISTAGLYTAPSSISSTQTVTVLATSVADNTKSGQAIITLNPPAPTTTAITWPIEVMGGAGTVASVNFSLSSAPSGSPQLSLTTHGVKYQTEASVQVNNSAWIALNTANVTLLGLASNYGGFGGGFRTLSMTVNLPAGTLTAGTNTIRFRFEGTDGVTSGYRVLAFNFLGASGNPLIPSNTFVEDDPSLWAPPSTLASDIAAGQSLWRTASLTVPLPSGGTAPIQAHCGDCHAQDGRDLKYFNYSNNAIVVRATFHGLTAAQGNQIASYIRSLADPSAPNGRPWNPPYQPGPGLDSQPVQNWAAGAGLSAVLPDDASMQNYLAPSGSTTAWASNQYLNVRELPIALQFPDWNSWLPQVHPIDAFGASFTSSQFNTLYSTIRSTLAPNNSSVYAANTYLFDQWNVASDQVFLLPYESPSTWTQTGRQALYAAALWQMVKMWEINQDFGLEGMSQAPFGAKGNLRGWYTVQAFDTSPIMLHIPAGPGLGNGTGASYEYLAYIWYHLQLVLNDGQGKQSDHTPIDYGYVEGAVKGLSLGCLSPSGGYTPEAMLEIVWLIKALQEYTLKGVGPGVPLSAGFVPTTMAPVILVHGGWESDWNATPAATRATLTQAYAQVWFNQVSTFAASQYWAGTDGGGRPWATTTENPSQSDFLTQFGGQLWYMLPRLRYEGVSPTLTYSISAWAATVWPAGNWALNNAGTCTSINSCTSD